VIGGKRSLDEPEGSYLSRAFGMSESVDRLVFMVYIENSELRQSFFKQLKSQLDSN
jgi:hypothetical protein